VQVTFSSEFVLVEENSVRIRSNWFVISEAGNSELFNPPLLRLQEIMYFILSWFILRWLEVCCSSCVSAHHIFVFHSVILFVNSRCSSVMLNYHSGLDWSWSSGPKNTSDTYTCFMSPVICKCRINGNVEVAYAKS